jgi:pimeloyl-ACP methyl ester carboxylesterase
LALRSFSDGALFAESFGDRPPTVLALHGWGRRGADFKKSLAEIPALAPDLPGFGATPPPPGVIGAHGYADAIRSLLEEFDSPPVVVGHSFGGRVAVCLAAEQPEQIGPLVLTGVPLVRTHSAKGPSFSYRLLRSLHRLGVIGDERMEEIRSRRGSADYQAAEGVMRAILVKVVNESYEEELGRVRSPVTLLWGVEDREVPVEVARAAAEALVGSEVTIELLEGVGHHVPVEAPDELRRAVESVL